MVKPSPEGHRPVQSSALGSIEGSHWVLHVKRAAGELYKILDPTNTMNAERRRATGEAPSHLLRGGRLSLREANSAPQARLPMTVHPPPSASAHTHIYVLWQVSSLVQATLGAPETDPLVSNPPVEPNLNRRGGAFRSPLTTASCSRWPCSGGSPSRSSARSISALALLRLLQDAC